MVTEENYDTNPDITGHAHSNLAGDNRNKEILRLYLAGYTYQEVGDKFNLTRERIRQIVIKRSYKDKINVKQIMLDRKANAEAADYEQTLKGYLLLSKKLGRIPYLEDVAKYTYKFRKYAIRLRQDAEQAGYKFVKLPKESGNDALLQHLRELATALGHTPTLHEINRAGKYSHMTYHNHFGSLTEAQKLAGLIPNPRGNGNPIGKEKILEDYKRLFNMFGRKPRIMEINKHGKYSYRAYQRYLGDLKNFKFDE